MWPFVVVALVLRPDLHIAFGLITTALWLIVLRNQRKPYFTSTHLHSGRGWFGLTKLAIPLIRIDDVVVEPVQVLPGMGTINVRYGLEYLSFECVADAERKAALLRQAVARAVAKGLTMKRLSDKELERTSSTQTTGGPRERSRS
jgi:hypothetical protein